MISTKLIVTLILIAVAFVFIAPSVSLEPTALRAAQAALAFFTALTSACLFSSGLTLRSFFQLPLSFHEPHALSSEELIDLTCSRLC
jgi:hypothetical protein